MKAPDHLMMFCHIEKCGGTTLIEQFRTHLGIRHVDLIPADLKANQSFRKDLENTMRRVPFAISVAAHSLKPHVDYGPNIVKYTLLRDPVARYVSEFSHDRERRGFAGDLEKWMTFPARWNYQTKFLAGSDDVEKAKKVLAENVAFFGFTDRYDEFLAIINNHLAAPAFQAAKSDAKNVSASKRKMDDALMAEARKRNSLDYELHEFARGLYEQRYAEWKNVGFAKRSGFSWFGRYGNVAFRNFYYKPTLGLKPLGHHALPVNSVNVEEAARLGLNRISGSNS